MKNLLQKQHSVKINVSDGKYECHLQHLPLHTDESRDLIKLIVLSTVWFQKYWRIVDYSGAVSYMLALFLSIFGHSWRQNTDWADHWPDLVAMFLPRFVKDPFFSAVHLSFSPAWVHDGHLRLCIDRGQKMLIWSGSWDPPLRIIHHTFSLAGAEHLTFQEEASPQT